MLSREALEKAFAYFGITDEAYRSALLADAAAIYRESLTKKLFRDSRDAVFCHDYIRREKLAELEGFLAGTQAPACFTALLLLSAADVFAKKQVTYHLTAYDVDFAKQKVRRAPYNRWKMGENLYFELFLWVADFLNGNETFCGSLIFQRYNDKTAELHIPKGADLSPAMVRQSIAMAPAMLAWRYAMEQPEIRCESWLLSPEVQAICRPGSNIARFSDFFDIAPGEDCTEDVFRNLFPKHNGDLLTLPEDTSLRRAVKAFLLQGGRFRIGNGTVKAEFL